MSRLENAIKKLYIAFNENTLNPECCKQCAVGNILDKTDSWKYFSDDHGTTNLNYVGQVNQLMGKRFNGYTPEELLKIEATFLKACGYQLPYSYRNKKPNNPEDKDILLKGLLEVIDLLYTLDGEKNIINYNPFFSNKKSTSKLKKESKIIEI
ncbi:Na(+)-translocating NADH-quinone reductase subunit F [Tamlana sp. 62-3]|uniref:Na(+)-translocating NADH-quinone reductase subunit F n=1 Tax=Neotamlana sargassicola TaxID=2883125 RepID=A0A9X1L5W8_9FLAO|nr:Na(+)-translocating NADH-quinone reductase subunit F [Tamlana sargassicola]MCB4809540.1 Na(+)-translocating NADH-quinone reductase subunit F [Tamlana sargassicola]